jgi:hypothetical protein
MFHAMVPNEETQCIKPDCFQETERYDREVQENMR